LAGVVGVLQCCCTELSCFVSSICYFLCCLGAR
jgi:hypothetical protein